MKDIAVFDFHGEKVRSTVINGEPWFVASDVAKVLGYSNPQKAVRDHCKWVNKTVHPSNGGNQTMLIIPERDLYRLVMRSKLPGAEEFEEWVVSEVLPSIRKTGSYTSGRKPSPTRRPTIPSGAALREWRMIYGENAAIALSQHLGIDYEIVPFTANLGRISKPAFAVEMKEREKQRFYAEQQRQQGELF